MIFQYYINYFQSKVESLHKAVEESHWDTVRELLEDNKLIRAADRTGLPVLHKAVIMGFADLVKSIIENFDALTTTDNVSTDETEIIQCNDDNC